MGYFFFIILLVFLTCIGFGSYFISNQVYKKLLKSGNESANLLRVVTFLVSFLVIFAALAYIILNNIRLER